MSCRINEKFKIKFPFAYNYFSSFLDLALKKEKNFPQALIFEGTDTKNQYLFALELARVLNCEKEGDFDCNCTNCKWVREYSHPAINIVSQIHCKPEGDETKTVISVKQAKEIEKSLSISSNYHRFYIFFSSKEKKYDENELKDFTEFNYSTDFNYSIEPLNFETFHPNTPNALLKSVEEPPLGTTFVFLTKSKEDILSTIVSRCLVFKLSGEREKIDYSLILNLLKNYPSIDYNCAFEVSQNFQQLIKDEELDLKIILDKFLEYLKDLLKQNLDNPSFALKIQNDIKLVNQAMQFSRANISDKNVLDGLFLRIARGY